MSRKTAVILIVISMLLGAGGTYAGVKYIDDDQPVIQSDQLTSVEDKAVQQEVTNDEEDFTKVEEVFELIKNRYVEQIDDSELIEGAIEGMIETLEDPFSSYMDKETADQFNQSLSSSFEGIGAEVSMEDGILTIVTPFKNSPAEKAGLKSKDKVIKVDGESIEGLDLFEAVLKIRGEKGTTVVLEVIREGVSDTITFDVVRDEIPIETVYSSVKEHAGKSLGYIQITSFSEDTDEDFEQQLEQLEKQNIDGLVVDVRGNGGGYLDSVEKMLKQLVTKDKPYVQIEDRNGEKLRSSSSLKEQKPYPIVALINEGSASASEIFAVALKEAGGYDIIGETSFGKGTVQQAIPMDDGSSVKLTQFKWLTPDGNWIHEKGVEPTIEVKQPAYFYTNPIQFEEDLTYDMNSEHIKNIQIMLKGLGFDPGREDGYFGKETETAVSKFQQANNLEATGVINQETATQIEDRIIEEIGKEENDAQLKAALEQLTK
ncbi:S41 family peptidase [Cytobacillus sp. IB215316]|uniref:S41 family peptidase n=1 Tax=Cytobacillus sp. IB215316 TaxID=3097354 RepID=UPI002A0CEA4B|nr:S41 family peptidase [Cytobacillus sp. IB215316]MDX8360588.1 S41 family peptidase [Cytobacillus sp. IB215316]